MQPPVSEATLNQLQAIAEASMMDDVVIINPGTAITLPNGGWAMGEETSILTKGEIGALSDTVIEKYTAERVEYAGLEQLDVPKNTIVGQQSRVSVTSKRHGGTRKYTVEGVTPLGTYSVSRVLIVKAVK